MSDYGEQPRRERTARLPRDEEENGAVQTNPRSTEQRIPPNNDWSEQELVNPGWRRDRSASAPRSNRRRIAGAPSGSPQEFQLWLQKGGWMYVAGAAVLVIVLLIAALAWTRGDDQRRSPQITQRPTAATAPGSGNLQPLATATTAPPTAALPAAPAAFTVTGTGELGLFLRSDPSTASTALETLPDGTRVEKIGDDFTGPDRVWRRVRAPSGQEGWVAVEFLRPAQ